MNLKAQNGHVVQVHYTGKLQTGEMFDTSEGKQPLEFTLGKQMMIPGFEAGIIGMSVGDKKTIEIPAAEAYGEASEEMILTFPISQLPEGSQVEPGMQLGLTAENGQQVPAMVVEVNEDSFVVDANHPLAGKDLVFDVEIVDIKSSLIVE